jgi:hypothetical protein
VHPLLRNAVLASDLALDEDRTQARNLTGLHRSYQPQPRLWHRLPVSAGTEKSREWDFFLSYTQADRAWAEWLAWVLEEHGYRVLIQAWDFVPGSNWIAEMQAGTQGAARTIAVLSEAYLKSVYGGAEWQAAWASDPDGTTRRLLVVRVGDCERRGLLSGIVSIDLFALAEDQARTELLGMAATAEAGRAKPARAPGFPGTHRMVPDEPGFPGELAEEQPAIARWRATLSGHEAASLSRLMQVGMSHRGYMRPSGTEPPSIRIGLGVPSGPVSPTAGASAMRTRFIEFLRTSPIMDAVTGITHPSRDASWNRQAGNGPATLEAALTSAQADAEQPPIAAAKLLLPETGYQHYGGDPERAVLILHIEPRNQDGLPAGPAGLATWYTLMLSALAAVQPLASFLTGELDLKPADMPSAQLGLWLKPNGPLTELIDPGELQRLAGGATSSEISIYAIADSSGKEARDVVADLLSYVCEYGLRLDDYEPVMHRLAAAPSQ